MVRLNINPFGETHSNSIGFRVPDLRLARDLLMTTGPLATSSANISGKAPVKDALEASISVTDIHLVIISISIRRFI